MLEDILVFKCFFFGRNLGEDTEGESYEYTQGGTGGHTVEKALENKLEENLIEKLKMLEDMFMELQNYLNRITFYSLKYYLGQISIHF